MSRVEHNDKWASVVIVVTGGMLGLLACYITKDFLLLVNVKIKQRSVLNSGPSANKCDFLV